MGMIGYAVGLPTECLAYIVWFVLRSLSGARGAITMYQSVSQSANDVIPAHSADFVMLLFWASYIPP